MANRSSNKGDAGRKARPSLQDSTIALTESQIAVLEVPKGPPPPPPGRATGAVAAVPQDASLWPGLVVGADDFAAVAPPRRRMGVWILAGALATALVGSLAWWGSRPDGTALQNASWMPGLLAPLPTAVAAPEPAPVRRATTRAAAKSSTKSASMTKQSVTRTRSVSGGKTTTTVKRTKRTSSSKRTTTSKRTSTRKRTTR